jgi:VWFA-related protein
LVDNHMRSILHRSILVVAGLGAGLVGLSTSPAAQGAREAAMFVSAVDSDGVPVEGLGPDAFIIRADGARREVLRVSRATEPMDVAVLVDNSTAARQTINHLRGALPELVSRLASSNQVALIGLSERPTIIVDYTSDIEELSKAASSIFAQPNSGMTLLDAIVETSQGLSRRPSARAAIVAIITEGPEFTNRYSRDVVARLRDANAALHVVGVGRFAYSDDHATRERLYVIDDGTRETGGQRITMLTSNAIEGALQKLAAELTSQYKVVYASPDTLIRAERVVVSSGRDGVTMRGTPARGEPGV